MSSDGSSSDGSCGLCEGSNVAQRRPRHENARERSHTSAALQLFASVTRNSCGAASASSPRREPWVRQIKCVKPRRGERSALEGVSFAAPRLVPRRVFTHGLRRGLLSVATPWLVPNCEVRRSHDPRGDFSSGLAKTRCVISPLAATRLRGQSNAAGINSRLNFAAGLYLADFENV